MKPIVFTSKEIRIMVDCVKTRARRQELASRAPMADDVKYTRTALKKLLRLQEMTE